MTAMEPKGTTNTERARMHLDNAERLLQKYGISYTKITDSYICVPVAIQGRKKTRPLVWIDFYPATGVWEKRVRDEKDAIHKGRGIMKLLYFMGVKR